MTTNRNRARCCQCGTSAPSACGTASVSTTSTRRVTNRPTPVRFRERSLTKTGGTRSLRFLRGKSWTCPSFAVGPNSQRGACSERIILPQEVTTPPMDRHRGAEHRRGGPSRQLHGPWVPHRNLQQRRHEHSAADVHARHLIAADTARPSVCVIYSLPKTPGSVETTLKLPRGPTVYCAGPLLVACSAPDEDDDADEGAEDVPALEPGEVSPAEVLAADGP